MIYNCDVSNFSANGNNSWLTPEVNYGSLDASSTGSVKLLFDSHGLNPDTYNCLITMIYNFSDTLNIPVTFEVFNENSVEELNGDISGMQVFPNPFTNQTALVFMLNKPTKVALSISDLNGRIIKTLASESMSSGEHNYFWDGTDEKNNKAAPGIYFYRLITDESVAAGRIILIK